MAFIDTILRSGNSVIKWLQLDGAKPFTNWLLEWQKQALKDLSSGKDPVEMYRAQGRLEVLNRILGLKSEVLDYQDNVRTGKVKRIL